MKKNKTVFIEICIVVAFIIIFLLTKMIGQDSSSIMPARTSLIIMKMGYAVLLGASYE